MWFISKFLYESAVTFESLSLFVVAVAREFGPAMLVTYGT